MKQMEYTIKVITNGPVDGGVFTKAIVDTGNATSAEVTNYRVKPQPREKSAATK